MSINDLKGDARLVSSGDLTTFLKDRGDDSVSSFLRRFPGVPLVELANRFPGSGLTAAAICRAQMREAARVGELREAAMDCLVREINASFPNGWGLGDISEIRKVGPIVALTCAITLDAQAPHFEENAERVWQSLVAKQPPTGWHPISPDDPLIRCAFEEGWPAPPDSSK